MEMQWTSTKQPGASLPAAAKVVYISGLISRNVSKDETTASMAADYKGTWKIEFNSLQPNRHEEQAKHSAVYLKEAAYGGLSLKFIGLQVC